MLSVDAEPEAGCFFLLDDFLLLLLVAVSLFMVSPDMLSCFMLSLDCIWSLLSCFMLFCANTLNVPANRHIAITLRIFLPILFLRFHSQTSCLPTIGSGNAGKVTRAKLDFIGSA